MDHQEAARAQTVERYMLGELRGAERDEFENHFFECTECAEAVRSGVWLADNAAAEWRSSPALESVKVPSQRRSWLQSRWWQAAFAAPAFALSAVSLLWMEDHRRLQSEVDLALAPQGFSSVQLNTTRGAGEATVTRDRRFFAVSFYIEPDALPEYAVEIAGNGIAPATVLLPQQKNQRYNILLPVARYRSGAYSIDVKGGPGTDGRAVQHFALRLQ